MEESLKGKLTEEEWSHLRDDAKWTTSWTITSGFKIQKILRDYHPGSEPCARCKAIASKLGYPV